MGHKFRRNCSISHGEGDRSKFVFCHFWQKFKMVAIFGEGKFLNIAKSTFVGTLWVKNFDEIVLSRTVKEI